MSPPLKSEWFESGWGEPIPTDKLKDAIRRGLGDRWPSRQITFGQVADLLGEERDIGKFFSSEDNSHNPIQAESNLAFTVAQRIAGHTFDGENEEETEKEHLAGLYLIWLVEDNDDKAKARVDQLVVDIENVVYGTTGIPRPMRPSETPGKKERLFRTSSNDQFPPLQTG